MQLPEVPDFYEIDAVHDPRPADQPSINRLHIQVKELQDERSKAKKVDRLQLACIALLFLMGFFSSSVCLALLIQGKISLFDGGGDQCDTGWDGPRCDVCATGWTGPQCDTCATGWAGALCEVCATGWAGAQCDTCALGWTGAQCDACALGWGGKQCEMCATGWAGVECDACALGWAGVECDTCALGWAGAQCDICALGWAGAQCDTCALGWAGAQCDACALGWTGSRCDSCDVNWIGPTCNVCAAGWAGPRCDICAEGWKGSACNTRFTYFQKKEDWMALRPTKSAYFSSTGMVVTGNSDSSGNSYPVATSLSISGDSIIDIELRVYRSYECSDHGIAIFPKGGSPVWSWSSHSSRLAFEINCNRASVASPSSTQSGHSSDRLGTYTYKISFQRGSYLKYQTINADGILDDYVLTNSAYTSLPYSSSNLYEIGFDADDDESRGSRFTYFSLSITSP